MGQAQAPGLEARETHTAGRAFDFPPRLRTAPAPRQPSRPRIGSHPVRPSAQRRTVEIAGRTTPARPQSRSRRPGGANPDRLALWAVVLCLFMALVAAATARGDQPASGGDQPAAAAER
jgi:hypothetical protein